MDPGSLDKLGEKHMYLQDRTWGIKTWVDKWELDTYTSRLSLGRRDECARKFTALMLDIMKMTKEDWLFYFVDELQPWKK